MFEIVKCTADHPDAAALIAELSGELEKITGDNGRSSFSPMDVESDRSIFLLVIFQNKPVACGALREHSQTVCELKRMYSKHRGAGGFLLKTLEQFAADHGYDKIILSTRKINQKAILFYEHHGYRKCNPYGKYKYGDVSVCMSKVI